MNMKPKLNESDEEEFLSYLASDADRGQRLDAFAATVGTVTRSAVERWIADGRVTVNGVSVPKNYRMRSGDRVELLLPPPEISEIKPQKIDLDVIYEDSDLIVINKPVGMVVHPAPGNPDGTLVNALLHHCGNTLSGIGGVVRPGIVHRIDKDTSGLLVVAKNDETHLALSEQLKGHHINRIYTAIVLGTFRESSGTVNASIGRHPIERKKMAVIQDPSYRSREAVTHWRVLAEGASDGARFSLIRCELETGRTHQIRVHMAYTGHPLLGDSLYGGGNTRFEARHHALISGQCLHAGELSFLHPRTGVQMTLTAPMPPEMEKLTKILFGNTFGSDENKLEEY